MRNLDSLLQKRNGRLVFAPLTETCAGKTIYCSSLARGTAGKRLRTVS